MLATSDLMIHNGNTRNFFLEIETELGFREIRFELHFTTDREKNMINYRLTDGMKKTIKTIF